MGFLEVSVQDVVSWVVLSKRRLDGLYRSENRGVCLGRYMGTKLRLSAHCLVSAPSAMETAFSWDTGYMILSC